MMEKMGENIYTLDGKEKQFFRYGSVVQVLRQLFASPFFILSYFFHHLTRFIKDIFFRVTQLREKKLSFYNSTFLPKLYFSFNWLQQSRNRNEDNGKTLNPFFFLPLNYRYIIFFHMIISRYPSLSIKNKWFFLEVE